VVFLEKYLDRAKHIEVQIFGDASGKAHHLFDRECSVQRRHQKIVEEALSPSLDDNLRRDVTESARALAEGSSYRSAGTVEFLLQDGKFYFMEMNTRLQVEHPVTEMVVGVDLVKSQIITAAGRPVSFDRRPVQARGHAIECRLYAEDAYNKSLPSTGELALVDLPHGPGRRFDVGFEVGDVITPFFDPMIGKLIVWDETRPRAIQKMLRVIHDTIVFGVRTNLPFLREILRHPEFLEGTMDTRFVEKFFPDGVTHRPSYADSDMLFEIVDRELSMPSDSNGRKMDPWGHRWGRS
jgi:3-methylcrotonyl-CoA carboxylase alpha subunit